MLHLGLPGKEYQKGLSHHHTYSKRTHQLSPNSLHKDKVYICLRDFYHGNGINITVNSDLYFKGFSYIVEEGSIGLGPLG